MRGRPVATGGSPVLARTARRRHHPRPRCRNYRSSLRRRRERRTAPAKPVDPYDPPEDRYRVANYLAEHGMVEELQRLVDTGYEYAKWRLLNLRADRGDTAGLRELADTGHSAACRRLSLVLGERGRIDDLGHRALCGDDAARAELQWLVDTAEDPVRRRAAGLLRHGLDPDGTPADPLW